MCRDSWEARPLSLKTGAVKEEEEAGPDRGLMGAAGSGWSASFCQSKTKLWAWKGLVLRFVKTACTNQTMNQCSLLFSSVHCLVSSHLYLWIITLCLKHWQHPDSKTRAQAKIKFSWHHNSAKRRCLMQMRRPSSSKSAKSKVWNVKSKTPLIIHVCNQFKGYFTYDCHWSSPWISSCQLQPHLLNKPRFHHSTWWSAIHR